jgi:hypothetical protein
MAGQSTSSMFSAMMKWRRHSLQMLFMIAQPVGP